MKAQFSKVSVQQFFRAFLPVLIVGALGGCSTFTTTSYDKILGRRAAVESGSGSAAGNFLAARYAGSQRDAQAAATFFAKAVEADPDNVAVLDSAFLLELSAGNVDKSVALANRIIAIDPDARMARLVRASHFAALGQFNDAGKELDAVPPRSLADVVWVSQRAWAHVGDGDVDAAIALLNEPDVLASVGAFSLYHQALILDVADRRIEAEKAYKSAFEAVDGQSVRLVEAYGAFLNRTGQQQRAFEVFGGFLAQYGGHPSILASRETLRKTGRLEPLVSSAADGAAEAFYGIAGAIAGEGAVEVPITYLQLALYLDPDLDIGWALMGEFREEQEQWEEAAFMFAEVHKDSPLAAAAAISIARNLSKLDRGEEAIKLLRNRLGKDRDNIDLLVALADQMRLIEEYDEAAKLYGRALAVAGQADQTLWQIVYARGIALERAGRWGQAEPLFLQALDLAPDEPQVLNYLGYTWINRGENLDRALEMIYKAVDQRPNDGYIVDSLGWAYYRMGDFETAAYYLERAVELRPEDPTINDHLGDAYWRVGRYNEARFQWNHALEFLQPGSEPDKRRIEKKLKNGLDDKPAKTGS